MSEFAFRVGTKDDVKPEGDWIFVDLGFARQQNKSTGYLHIERRTWDLVRELEESLTLQALQNTCLYTKAENVTFGSAVRRVLCAAEKNSGPLNLVLEAPLSCAFDKTRNPIPRFMDYRKDKKATRSWYRQPGPIVMVSALFLLHRLGDIPRRCEIRVFEGFVSWKGEESSTARSKSDHRADVCALAAAVYAKRCIATSTGRSACLEPLPFLPRGLRETTPTVICAEAPS